MHTTNDTTYLMGPADSLNNGRDTVMVLDNGFELTCFNSISELSDGAAIKYILFK